MTVKTDEELIDALRVLITRRGLKVPALAQSLNINRRSLQNYLYKKSRMPVGVYLALCREVGVTGDYFTDDRFKIDTNALKKALDWALGDILDSLEFDKDMTVSVTPKPKPRPEQRRGVLTILGMSVQSRYDIIKENELHKSLDEGEGE